MTSRVDLGSTVDIAAQSCCFSALAGLRFVGILLAIDAGVFSSGRVGPVIMPHD